MRKLTALVSAASFLAIVGLGSGARAGSERHRNTGRARPVGADLLRVDTREAAVIAIGRGGMMAAAMELFEEEGFARVTAEAKLAPPAARGLQVLASSSDAEFEGSSLAARPELAKKLARSEAVSTIQVKALAPSAPTSELLSGDEE